MFIMKCTECGNSAIAVIYKIFPMYLCTSCSTVHGFWGFTTLFRFTGIFYPYEVYFVTLLGILTGKFKKELESLHSSDENEK